MRDIHRLAPALDPARRRVLARAALLGALAMTMPAGAADRPVFTDQVAGEAIDARIDPELREIAIGAAKGGGLPAAFPAKRAAFDEVFRELGGPPEAIHAVEDLRVPRAGGAVPVRVYRPSAGVLPVVVYTHGGGFEKGSLASHDAPLRRLARACGCVIVAVDYRLAPEHTFPAQTDDAYAVLTWVARQAAEQRFDANRIAVAGDSVGGNLAAVNAIRARDEGGPKLVLQVLFYPVTDVTLSSESWRRFAKGPWLSHDYERTALQAQYLPAGHDPKDPRVSPLYADPQGLPPAFVVNAEFDGYRDEGQAYAARLRAAGIATDARIYPGTIHDFFLMTGKSAAARRLVDDAGAALRRAFGTGG